MENWSRYLLYFWKVQPCSGVVCLNLILFCFSQFVDWSFSGMLYVLSWISFPRSLRMSGWWYRIYMKGLSSVFLCCRVCFCCSIYWVSWIVFDACKMYLRRIRKTFAYILLGCRNWLSWTVDARRNELLSFCSNPDSFLDWPWNFWIGLLWSVGRCSSYFHCPSVYHAVPLNEE